jgi:hypothetical protein
MVVKSNGAGGKYRKTKKHPALGSSTSQMKMNGGSTCEGEIAAVEQEPDQVSGYTSL